jgi:hypothetical protein
MGADAARRFCRLEVTGGGSWPLMLNSVAPRVGEKVYAADVAANGEVMLREGAVKRVSEGAKGRVVDASIAATPEIAGRPLLDADGRVVAVALVTEDGKAQHVGVPADWLEAARPRAAPPKPAEAEGAPAPKTARPPQEAPTLRDPTQITPERRERLEKAFRPPPTVPDDI